MSADMGVVVLVVMVAGLATSVELFRSRTRRRFVEQEVAAEGLTLLTCRYSFQPFRVNWNTYFRVRVTDRSGIERSGIASATGFLRAKARIDWD